MKALHLLDLILISEETQKMEIPAVQIVITCIQAITSICSEKSKPPLTHKNN